MISKEEILQTADLCKLKLSDEEIEIFGAMFSNVLKQIKELDKVDTEGVEPLIFLDLEEKPLKEDVPGDNFDRKELLKNAPEEEYGYFKLKKVMD
ncbi:Asp-tRNA(Asn)/Glu-tRNA(Gln) amidotransferase subunit GatC [Tepidimicrobium xylanilyticum]|uniref:Asp-tRNA(Asn)/Glu-tRNA(Gln) amidotransferase subunit GatC n=1 Tax=Tepidimicrobium xylanilyticum TaxID=1123352 RepID=UPI00264AC0D5|nr:Asp-tRNA(Asn)/Glu-tRNA(Gln) amidotransferase subunit GatC [Tepidimicrobium xylanilyticum]GMG95825.1 aspartyl/glutamyl-tRNA(Asn/Gln) amidotransferase subunit C [Tepidimicrobium xylanilyticum]